MAHILALEPDAGQADALRRGIADRGLDLRVVADPEAAIAEINRQAPDILLVGRSVPTGRRDAVVAHAKKTATSSTGLTVLEIPSFRPEGPQERRFLKFGFKKASGSDGADVQAFVEQLTATLAKRGPSRRRAASRQPDRVPTPPLVQTPATRPPSPPPVVTATVDEEAVAIARREADVRLLAEVERLHAEMAEQRQEELLVLEREATVIRENAVARAVQEAEAAARTRFSAELDAAHARADERLANELARAHENAAQELHAELAQLRQTLAAEATAREDATVRAAVQDAVRDAVQNERERLAVDARRAIDSAVATARAEITEQTAHTTEQAVARARAEVAAHTADAATRAVAQARAEADLVLENERRQSHAELEGERRAHARATEQLAAQEEQLRTRVAEVTRLSGELDGARETIERHSAELRHTHDELVVRNEEIQRVRDALATADAQHAAASHEASLDIARLRGHLDHATQTIDELHAAAAQRDIPSPAIDHDAVVGAEVAALVAAAEARFETELDAARSAAAAAKQSLADSHERHRELVQRSEDERSRLESMLAEVRDTLALATDGRAERDARVAAELAQAREEAAISRDTADQATRERDEARRATDEAVRAAALRAHAETESRFAKELARAHDELTAAHAARGQAERAYETTRHVAEQAVHAEAARVRAETEAQFDVEFVRLREELTEARLAAERATKDLDAVRTHTSHEARAAADAASARALHEEVGRVRAETESRLEEQMARLRDEADGLREALRDTQRELEQARKMQPLPLPAAVAPTDFRARASAWSRPSVGGGTIDYRPRGVGREFRVAVAAATVTVLIIGIAVAIGLPSLAVRSLRSITGQRISTDATSTDAPTTTAATPARRTSRPASRQSDPAPGSSETGFVRMVSRIPVDVFDGSRRLGTSDDNRLLLPAGPHRLRLVNPRFNFEGVATVDVKPGLVTTHAVALPRAQVQLTAPAGAEIWFEGQMIGIAPLMALSVPIGTRELVVRHAGLEKRYPIEVRVGATTEVVAMIDEPPVDQGLPAVMPEGVPPAFAFATQLTAEVERSPYRTSSSSTSKRSVAFGGIEPPPAPCDP